MANTLAINIRYITELRYDRGMGTVSVRDEDVGKAEKLLAKYDGASSPPCTGGRRRHSCGGSARGTTGRRRPARVTGIRTMFVNHGTGRPCPVWVGRRYRSVRACQVRAPGVGPRGTGNRHRGARAVSCRRYRTKANGMKGRRTTHEPVRRHHHQRYRRAPFILISFCRDLSRIRMFFDPGGMPAPLQHVCHLRFCLGSRRFLIRAAACRAMRACTVARVGHGLQTPYPVCEIRVCRHAAGGIQTWETTPRPDPKTSGSETKPEKVMSCRLLLRRLLHRTHSQKSDKIHHRYSQNRCTIPHTQFPRRV